MKLTMNTIFFLKGIPASGKSTWAKKQMEESPGRFKRINKDSLREMIDNGNFSVKNENIILEIRDSMLEKFLRRGYDVIIDDTNFKDKHWYDVCRIAERVGNVLVKEKFFHAEIDEIIERNTNRQNSVPESVIYKMYNKYIKNKGIEEREFYFPPKENRPNINPELPSCIIVDIDGTLAINTSRNYYDYSKVDEDEPNVPICDIVRLYNKMWEGTDNKIIIFTGREDWSKELTELWLEANEIPYDEIYMRQTGDRRKDKVIKKEMFDEYIKDRYNIFFVLDDRNQVVEMWRDMGLITLQVNFGDF